MSEAVETYEGFQMLHDFRTINWERWNNASVATRKDWIQSLNILVASWNNIGEEEGATGLFRILGHKADLLLMHFRENIDDLVQVESELDKVTGEWLSRPYSYYSIVELSKYLAQGDADPKTNAFLKARLYPTFPQKKTICFYPMSKRRMGDDNWYTLSREERAQFMRSHGLIGRKYSGEITQIISGSQGLDDWEWGVTLFADSPLSYKKIVYEMRFDEASARYADFGPFIVGIRSTFEDIEQFLMGP